MEPTFDPEALLDRLAEAGIDFVVVGAVAVGFHGVIRATKDLDVCPGPAPANYQRLARLLVTLAATHAAAADFAADEFPHDPTDPDQLALGGNFQLATALGPLDIMQWLPGIDGDQAFPTLAAEAVETAWRGRRLRICSLRHLRMMKRAAGRSQDLQDLGDLAVAHPEPPPGT